MSILLIIIFKYFYFKIPQIRQIMRNEFSINLEIKDMMKQFHKYKYKNRSTIH